MFKKCASSKNLKIKWHSDGKLYKDGFEFLKEQAPNWIDSLNKCLV